MEVDKEQIKGWLKSIQRTREWLADQCGVNKRTVDNWLSGGLPLPAHAILSIEKLMADPAMHPAPKDEDHAIVLKVNEDTFDCFNRAAMARRLTMRDWALDSLNRAAEEDAQTLRVAEEGEAYRAGNSAGGAKPGGSSDHKSREESA